MLDLNRAIVYDLETFPNVFSLNVVGLFTDLDVTFELSHFRDDRHELLQWFCYWRDTQAPMIGFNNLGFDYSVLHFIYQNPDCSVEDIYDHAMTIINNHGDRFGNMIWQSDRFAPQVDLFKIHHFDNRAKATSLKALQFAMRSESVMEMPIPFGVPLTKGQVDKYLIPYNKHDVSETKKFALYSIDAIKFRIELMETLDGDVVNWNDTKIGAKFVEQRLGDELCYTWESGRRRPRQTIRESVALNDIIFPHVRFESVEFNRILSWMRMQTLHVDEVTERLKTKGVFHGICATVGGIDFHFGTGGIHASVDAQRFAADAEWGIYDIDVSGMYPANMIANRLYPEHLGEKFIEVFAGLPIERAKYKKGTSQNALFKLGGNGTFGNTNNVHSVFLDPKVTMATTVNGQLLVCMLAEWLLAVDGLQIIQCNTDGITFRCRRALIGHTHIIRRIWERTTRLALEEVEYNRMWIRDCNNYVAESTDGKIKMKGAYWFARKFPDDISNSSPPAWHKDFSAVVTIKAAVEHMVTGVDIDHFVRTHGDQFDFMCRAKVDRSSQLWIGDKQVQRITRYYVAREGAAMKKVSPPAGPVGTYKRRNGMSDADYNEIAATVAPGVHDERIHTKNKSRYEIREFGIEAGYKVAECNRASDFDFNNVNFDWYCDCARKLVIP